MNDWILVVDDDTSNLKTANHILAAAGMRVSCMKSGADAVKFLEKNTPDLILLDINMPDMNGFETLAAIQQNETAANIPVVFLTADENNDTEVQGLKMGAMDFLKKPFIPDVLLLRIRHTIELVRLQTSLMSEVEKKTRKLEEQHDRLGKIHMQLVKALSGAIDAKDTYTNGHSTRVAEYSREIAKRAGFSEQEQNDIYMMGLLHDVGKIGIPDAIINKTSRLTDEEFAVIKSHPVTGAEILNHITDFPKLSGGARWHHERYDGKGYPDGKSGEEIPAEARIIAVADAYDAMTSKRSYRGIMPQETVRAEVEKCRGTQFDPEYADIMLAMIDEDKDYRMREQ